MRKKNFAQKCNKILTAILAAAVVMTTTVPESMVFAAENEDVEVDFQSEEEQENAEEVSDSSMNFAEEDTETEVTNQAENDGTEVSDVNDSDISLFDDESNASPIAETATSGITISVGMSSSVKYNTTYNKAQIQVSGYDSNRKCWLTGQNPEAFKCYPSSDTNKNLWYIQPEDGLTPGTYTATLHATYREEEATKEISLTVLPRTVYVKWGTHEFTYDKEKHVPAAELTSGSSFLAADTCHLEVEGAQTNAGTYTATVKVVTENREENPDNPCYVISSGQETQTFTINPRPVEFEWDYEDNHVFEYDGKPHTLTATATGVLEGDICNPVYQETTLDTSTPGLTGPKHCTVTITGVDNQNYTTKHGQQLYVSRAFYVVAKKLSKITLNPKKAKQYDGTTSFPTNASYYDYGSDGAFTSKIDGLVGDDNVYVSAIQSQSATLDNKDVGTDKALTLNVYLAGKDKYKYDFTDIQVAGTTIVQATGTATVDPKQVPLQWNTDKFRYDGNAHTPEAAIKNGVLSGETCNVKSVTVSGENLTEGKAVNAGTYTATATLDNPNYIPKVADKEFTVEKADSATVTAPEAKNLTYSGEAQELVTAGEAQGGKIQYRLSTDENWSDSIPKAANAGTYKVLYKVSGDSNHQETDEKEIEVTIKKADPAVTVVQAENLIYNGNEQKLISAGQTEDGKLVYKVNDGEWRETIPSGLDAGTYEISYKVKGDDNHNDSTEVQLTVTIAKKAVVVSGITAEDKTYDGNASVVLNYKGVKFDGMLEKDSLSVTAAGTFEDKNAGQKKVRISNLTLDGVSVKNYVLAKDGQQSETTAAIKAKEITVTPDNAKKYTGKADPKLTYKASGLVGADTLTGITVTRRAGEEIGKYDITASAEKDANPNYSITFEKAVFSIEQGDQSKLNAKSVAKLDLSLLLAKGQGGNKSINLSWLKYKGATGYDCYWSYCDGKQNYKKFATVKNGKLAVTHSKLKNNRKYKYFVVAYKMVDGRKIYVAKSNVLHVAMKEAAQTNAKAVSVNKTNVSLRNGKTFRIKAGVKLENSGKKEVSHAAAFRYYTANEKVATVSSRGVIKASGKGTTYVYVLANNGAYKKIKVTVK